MAEWSKAPDSSSGPLTRAWVKTQILTYFILLTFYIRMYLEERGGGALGQYIKREYVRHRIPVKLKSLGRHQTIPTLGYDSIQYVPWFDLGNYINKNLEKYEVDSLSVIACSVLRYFIRLCDYCISSSNLFSLHYKLYVKKTMQSDA